MAARASTEMTQGQPHLGVRPSFVVRKGCRRGQAILESLIVLVLLVAAALAFYDFAYASVSRLLLANGAARAARADTVGFNHFHRQKALNVGMIPVSGKRLVPDHGRTTTNGAGELALIRTYLQSEDAPAAHGILDYERWQSLSHSVKHQDELCTVTATFEVPELLPYKLGALFGVVPTDEAQALRSTWQIEDHASLYLNR